MSCPTSATPLEENGCADAGHAAAAIPKDQRQQKEGMGGRSRHNGLQRSRQSALKLLGEDADFIAFITDRQATGGHGPKGAPCDRDKLSAHPSPGVPYPIWVLGRRPARDRERNVAPLQSCENLLDVTLTLRLSLNQLFNAEQL